MRFDGGDIAVSILLVADIIGEGCIEGFLHIVLPSQAKDWLMRFCAKAERASMTRRRCQWRYLSHQRYPVELGVPAHVVSVGRDFVKVIVTPDIFAEVVPRRFFALCCADWPAWSRLSVN